MKKLLVPTDFSPNAKNALEYAIQIAQRTGAEIHIIHTFQALQPTGALVNMDRVLREDGEAQMRSWLNNVNFSVPVTTKVLSGTLTNIAKSYTRSEGIDLIVMGTQGASGVKEIFLGSHASAMISKTEVPLLAIPNNYQYQDIEEVVLAVDSEAFDNETVLEPLRALLKHFTAKLKVLHLEHEEIGAGVDPSLAAPLRGLDYSFHQLNDFRDINTAINDFVESGEANMLCMIRRKHSFFSQIFHVSATRREVFNSPVPLLILHAS